MSSKFRDSRRFSSPSSLECPHRRTSWDQVSFRTDSLGAETLPTKPGAQGPCSTANGKFPVHRRSECTLSVGHHGARSRFALPWQVLAISIPLNKQSDAHSSASPPVSPASYVVKRCSWSRSRNLAPFMLYLPQPRPAPRCQVDERLTLVEYHSHRPVMIRQLPARPVTSRRPCHLRSSPSWS